MKKQIFLVGYRATGKTTIGKELANILGWEFIDTDKEIERYTSKSIKEIFETKGEKAFREIESEVLKKLTEQEEVVFSTGGGIILYESNRNIIKQGIVILLECEIETIVSRMKKDQNRPPLTNLTLEEEIKKTLSERKKFYEEVANIKIVNENIPPKTVALLIKNLIPINNKNTS
ncbi:MAG: shikimate kinase [Brevinematia bacterium]